MDKDLLIAEAQLRIQRCEAALRQRTVSPEVVEVSIALMRLALVELQRPNHPVIPEGWQLVPVTPTPSMLDAAAGVDGGYYCVWKEMLHASPDPASPDEHG